MRRFPIFAVIAFVPVALYAQTPLQHRIAALAEQAQGIVSVACSLPGSNLNCDLNPQAHAPMQSVYKLPIGVAVLHAVEQGNFSLDQPIRFLTSDVYKSTFSPLQDQYPAANVDVPLRHLLELAVGLSDNTATDILIRSIGGTEPVQHYLDSIGLQGIQIRDSEASMHDDERRQYRNYGQPASLVKLLRMLADRSPITQEHTQYLLTIMTTTPTGPKRLRGLLPAGVNVAHKTGTSGYRDGIAAATNDVGLITLPDGRRLALAVLVTNAHADEIAVEATIATIARACYEAAVQATP